jgi:alkylhydroperoxidase/carboxymuconolactone decarboxylase family protein YurZ
VIDPWLEDTWKQSIGTTELTERQREIRDAFVRRRGYWADDWQLILEMDPQFLAAYTDVSAYAMEHGALDRRTRELIYVATGAGVTHQHPIGIWTHGRNALEAGATPEQLLAVMELVSTLGMATVHLAVSELEAAEPGTAAAIGAASGTTPERVARLRERYEEVHDAWDDELENVLQAVPDFYEAVLRMEEHPRRSGVLTAKEIALISFAVNALVTHRDEKALRRDIQAAKAAGVTPAELLDVCVQISGIGIHAITVGAPIVALLREHVARRTAST